MGKGKGKKHKRGGKPGGAAAGKRPEPDAAGSVARRSAVMEVEARVEPEARASRQEPSPSAAASRPAGPDHDFTWLKDLGIRAGGYALLMIGAYFVVVALFSPWGFNIWDTSGQKPLYGVFWLFAGGALLYGGWYLSSPPASPEERAQRRTEQPRRPNAR